MRVVTIPCRIDNFTYLVGADGTTNVAVVDPCDAQPVLDALADQGLTLVAILNTHHHGDHVGGNRTLLCAFPGIPVYAHRSDQGRIPGQTHAVDEGMTLNAAGLTFRVVFVPGHTSGHIAYLTQDAAFVGDTLFGAGCGRLFEGTAAQMNESLNVKLGALPDATRVYFAHEYTAANLRFAEHVEPQNAAVQARIEETKRLRDAGQWTTPSTLGLERRTNPFLRVNEAPVRARFASTPQTGTNEVFAALRQAKDRF